MLWTFEATRFWTGVEPKRADTVTGDAADPAPATWITDSPEAESVSSAWVAGGGRDGEPLDLISLHVRRETVVLIVAADSLEDSRQADALCNDLYAAALDSGATVHGAVIADEANIQLSYRDDAAGDDECLGARPREEDPGGRRSSVMTIDGPESASEVPGKGRDSA